MWNVFGGSDEEILETAPEVEQRSRKNSANALEDQEPRAGIDVGVSLAFQSKAERDKKHKRKREKFQTVNH